MDNEELLRQLHEAQTMIASLKSEKALLLNQIDALLAQNKETNDKLNEALLKLSSYQEKYNIERTRTFIPKTEKIDVVINETEEIIKSTRKSNKGKKYNKKSFDYEKYVVETRYIDPDTSSCPKCGSNLVIASSKTRYVVEISKPQIKVIKLIKRAFKCPNCNKSDSKLFYPISSDVFPNTILTPSFASFLLYNKFELGIPFEHLSKHLSNSIGFEISKQSIANHMKKIDTVLLPIYDKMKLDLLNNQSRVIHSDETTLVVSKHPDDISRKKSYVYVYSSSFYDPYQIRIYDFHESRAILPTQNWLNNYSGYIISDNFEGYNSLKKNNPNIKLQKCWAHVRRRFADIVKNLNQNQRKDSSAFKILNIISKLFDLESKYKKLKYTPNQILENRKKNFPPIKNELRNFIDSINPKSNSALESAINYLNNCWDDLFTCLENGCIEITNNTAERAVKPFVVQRKVFQTSGSYAGAKITGRLFSIIQTCLINGINVENYFNYVINNINSKPIDDLLPYNPNIFKMFKLTQ